MRKMGSRSSHGGQEILVSFESAKAASLPARVRRFGEVREDPLVEAGEIELGEQVIQVDLITLGSQRAQQLSDRRL